MSSDTLGMDKIHQILNYSFSKIDLVDYESSFFNNRKIRYFDLFSAELEEQIAKNNITSVTIEISSFSGQKPATFPVDSEGVSTSELLKWILWHLCQTNLKEPAANQYINRLQKKFEIHHRLFTRYRVDLRRDSDNYLEMEIYALLSLALALRFLSAKNFNDLNTSLKLNDLILSSKLSSNPYALKLGSLAIISEALIIRNLYELC